MKGTFHLDSSVCVSILRGKTSSAALPAVSQISISSIVSAELWTGVEKMAEARQRQALTAFLKLFNVLDFTHLTSIHYGDIRADLERKGTPIGPMDLLIAAHARSMGATLITGNTREFKRVTGLKVLPWR